MLDYAKARGLRQGENPARWRGHLDKLLAPLSAARRAKRERTGRGEHFAALPYLQVGAFVAELRKRPAIAARCLEFAILTAARTGEVIGAKWDEIDFDARVWTVPPERMKGGKEHRVPLSDAAMLVLNSMRGLVIGDYVFPGGARDQLSNMSMLMLLRRMGHPDLTTHGFRASFRTWAAEKTKFQNDIVEGALAHTVADKVVAAYQRGELLEKRPVMTAWAAYVATVQSDAKVLEFSPAPMRSTGQ